MGNITISFLPTLFGTKKVPLQFALLKDDAHNARTATKGRSENKCSFGRNIYQVLIKIRSLPKRCQGPPDIKPPYQTTAIESG